MEKVRGRAKAGAMALARAVVLEANCKVVGKARSGARAS